MSFWASTARATEDPINDDIWAHSPSVQRDIQPPVQVRLKAVGAQQAMLIEDHVLPWVPDVLGVSWGEPSSLLIVGSAYAPFIAGAAKRSRSMPLQDYIRAQSWQEFHARFIESVVRGDNSYYEPLSLLASATACSQNCANLAFLDLCRASFTEKTARGDFVGRDAVVLRHCALFERYVEHPTNEQWLFERVIASAATRIVPSELSQSTGCCASCRVAGWRWALAELQPPCHGVPQGAG